jgi:hypothetical protein
MTKTNGSNPRGRGRPKAPKGERRTTKSFKMPPQLWERAARYQLQEELPSLSAAVERLLDAALLIGLKAEATDDEPVKF